jgi:hypothetical protein
MITAAGALVVPVTTRSATNRKTDARDDIPIRALAGKFVANPAGSPESSTKFYVKNAPVALRKNRRERKP